MPDSSSLNSVASSRALFSQYLLQRGMRRTPERFAILDKVALTFEHFSIDSFYESLEDEGFHVSRATVYNTLQLLEECGLVRRHKFDNTCSRFEFVRGGPAANHHHLICTECGRIREVKDSDIARMLNSKRYARFNTSYFSLYLYGTCSRCARRLKFTKGSAQKSSVNK